MKINIAFFALLITLSGYSFAQDFTIGVIPDWQKLTYVGTDSAERMKEIAQWFVNHKQELNVVFVASLGDMSQGTYNSTDYSEDQWKRNTAALSILRSNGIPFSPNQGNHDPNVAINKYFPVSYFEKESFWGGSMNGKIENSYYKFEAAGMKFILLTTQWEKSNSVNDWANNIFKENSDKRAIFVNHSGLCKVSDNEYLVDPIVKHNDNIFLGLSGHLCEYNGEEFNKYTSIGGKTQYCIRTDYQCRDINDMPAAIIRYYTFKPNIDSVYAYTYDFRTQSYITDASSQFSFYYPMEHSPVISVIGVSLSQTTAKMSVGGSKLELIPLVLPTNSTNRSVRWTSSNPSVATVNSRGLVNAVAEGTVTITATSQDGGKTASSEIIVLFIPVTNIVLWYNCIEVSLKEGGSQQLNATVYPSDASNKSISWTSDNESIATVTPSGLVYGKSAGKANVIVTTLNGGKTAISIVTIVKPTSVENLSIHEELPKEFAILQNYPNPFNPSTIIKYQLPAVSIVTLEVYDILGRVAVKLFNGTKEAGYHAAIFDGSKLSSGIYFAQLVIHSQDGKPIVRYIKLILTK